MCVCLCVSVGRKSVCFWLAAASLKPPKRTFSLTLNQNMLSLSRALCPLSIPLVSCTRTHSYIIWNQQVWQNVENQTKVPTRIRKGRFPSCWYVQAISVFVKKKKIVHKQLSTQRFISVFNCKNIFQKTSIICEGNPPLSGGWEITLDLLADWFAPNGKRLHGRQCVLKYDMHI